MRFAERYDIIQKVLRLKSSQVGGQLDVHSDAQTRDDIHVPYESKNHSHLDGPQSRPSLSKSTYDRSLNTTGTHTERVVDEQSLVSSTERSSQTFSFDVYRRPSFIAGAGSLFGDATLRRGSRVELPVNLSKNDSTSSH